VTQHDGPSAQELLNRQQVLPLLDEIAYRCRLEGSPLLTLLACYWDDGTLDLATARRHWQIRYNQALPPDDGVAQAVIQREQHRVHQWQRQQGGVE
jgi:hypothetical protein